VVDTIPHLLAGLSPLYQLSEEAIVVGVNVPHMGHNGKSDSLRIRCFRGRRATDPAAGLAARVQSNLLRLGGRTGRKCRTHRGGKGGRVGLVGELATGRCLLASARAELGVGQTLLFSLSQARRLDQDTLSLVALASTRPFKHQCPQA
jgi:hypothetical protein